MTNHSLKPKDVDDVVGIAAKNERANTAVDDWSEVKCRVLEGVYESMPGSPLHATYQHPVTRRRKLAVYLRVHLSPGNLGTDELSDRGVIDKA